MRYITLIATFFISILVVFYSTYISGLINHHIFKYFRLTALIKNLFMLLLLLLETLLKRKWVIGAHVEFHIRGGSVTELANLEVQIRAFVNLCYVDLQVVSTICSVRASVTLSVLLPIMHCLYVIFQPLLAN